MEVFLIYCFSIRFIIVIEQSLENAILTLKKPSRKRWLIYIQVFGQKWFTKIMKFVDYRFLYWNCSILLWMFLVLSLSYIIYTVGEISIGWTKNCFAIVTDNFFNFSMSYLLMKKIQHRFLIFQVLFFMTLLIIFHS